MRKEIMFPTLLLLQFIQWQFLAAQTPRLTVDGKMNYGVVMQSMQTDIKVCGTVATTSLRMVFKNNTDKVLEGTLSFPLKNGCSVSRYALDINGKMREAVPVDRGKGAAVFEAVERRRIDPGLLEKVEGNIFRTRIYSLNPHNTRTVIIGYEEELPLLDNNLVRYFMPLGLTDTIAEFSLNIDVIQSALPPLFDSVVAEGLRFDQQNTIYSARLHRNNFVAAHALSFFVPKPKDATKVMLQEFENKFYYLVTTRLEKKEQEKILPKNITLLWDASLSGNSRNHAKEMDLLDAYFKKLNNANISLVTFSNKANSPIKCMVEAGQWKALRNVLDSIVYDGATNLGCLDPSKMPGDEFLLMSDGRQTFGNTEMATSNRPVYCINSSAGADYSNLKFIAIKTGGALIDLQATDLSTALQQLTLVPLQFLGIKKNKDIEENYPSLPVAVNSNFSAAGIAATGVKEIVLQFGYGNLVAFEKTMVIDADSQRCKNFDIRKIVAQKKIDELDLQYDSNRKVIESLGKRFGIVTRNTSLIVLETLGDYLLYEIEPPAELMIEYNKAIKRRNMELVLSRQNNLSASGEMMNELTNWFGQPVKRATQAIDPITNDDNELQPVPPAAATPGLRPHPRGDEKIISGTVRSGKDSSPVPGASVMVKVTGTRIASANAGAFSVRAREGDVLVFSSVGYEVKEVRVGTGAYLNVSLQEATNELQEVVVTGYGISRKRSLTGSVTVVSDAENASGNDEAVQRKTDVLNVPGAPGESGYTRLRGATGTLYGDTMLAGHSTAWTNKNLNGFISCDIKPGIKLSGDSAASDYIDIIQSCGKALRYKKYLDLRNEHAFDPVYYFNVASFFFKTGEKETGLKVLSNLAELETGSYELYKMLGYKLKETGDYNGEITAFTKVLELRPLDPQSYRDCALAKEDGGDYQGAFDLLYEGMTKTYSDEMKRIYRGIEEIFLFELNRLIALHPKLKRNNIPKTLVQAMPVDVRVVVNWNKNNTDIDLWVTDPDEEKCFYSNRHTAAGGRISSDFTNGFGPEQFLLKNAKKGKYRIEINYFGDTQATIAGPTTVMAEIYLHYGRPNEEKRIVTLQMEKGKSGAVFIGEVSL